jgi:hypothetical protein
MRAATRWIPRHADNAENRGFREFFESACSNEWNGRVHSAELSWRKGNI